MREFAYSGLPVRAIFGDGTLAMLAEEVRRLGISRALVLSTPRRRGMAEDAAGRLGVLAAGQFSEAAMHTPVEVTERAMAEVARCGADGVVAIGGGSTTGLGKAIALRTGLPQVVIPTTYAGSEMTPILGQTEAGRKTTLRDARVLPETVIYDVTLTLGLPVSLSAVSGLNAIAHAVEALYARDGNPVVDLMAEEGIAVLGRSLPAIVANPQDRDARADALYGAWLCGICLGSAGMALHHKLCHTLGGMFDLPHAETHAVILPHAMRYNTGAAPEAAARVARALGAQEAAPGLQALARRIGAPTALTELGLTAEAIPPAVAQVMSDPYWNPETLGAEGLERLLKRALTGAAA